MNTNSFKCILRILCVVCCLCCFENTLLFAQEPTIKLSLYENPIRRSYDAIENADQSVSAVIYKFDENSLLNAIIDALNRGVKVKLIVDDIEANKKKSLVNIAENAGADVRRWSYGKLHAKFMIIDNNLSITGSFNWTQSANGNNVELFIEYRDLMDVSKFSLMFDDLWALSAQ